MTVDRDPAGQKIIPFVVSGKSDESSSSAANQFAIFHFVTA